MKKRSFPWILLVAVLLPPGVFTVFGASSMAAGGVLACLVAIASHPNAITGVGHRTRPEVTWALRICLFAIVHLAFVSMRSPVDFGRAAASLVIVIIYLFGGRALSMAFFEQAPERVHVACRQVLTLLVMLLPIAFLDLIPSDIFGQNRIIFPYSEPSVYALGAMPFIAYMALRLSQWRRVAFLLVAFALGAFIKNLTLIVGLLMVACLCLRLNALVVVLALVSTGAASIDLSYFSNRLDLSSESENLSSLVYVQGWQLIDEALRGTSGFGIGFQQLGVQPTEVPAAQLIMAIADTELNRNDGGFVLVKLLSEFGVFGLAAVFALLVVIGRSAVFLRREAPKRFHQPSVLFARCVVVCYGLDLLVRGSGYFTATSLMLIAALHYLHLVRARRVKSPRLSSTSRSPSTATSLSVNRLHDHEIVD